MPRPSQQRLFDVDRSAGANERVDVKLWCVDDTRTKAVHMLVAPEADARRVWVPRSLMGDRISKYRDPGCVWWRWEFTLPRWKAEELGT